jgi:CBS domain-containing protein
MIDIEAVILGALVGMVLAVLLVYLYIRGLVREVVGELQQHFERVEASMLPVIVERHNGEIFCYGEEDKQFICQGHTLEEIRKAMKTRFPERVAYLAGGDEDLVRELREALVRDKVEGILTQTEEANVKVD